MHQRLLLETAIGNTLSRFSPKKNAHILKIPNTWKPVRLFVFIHIKATVIKTIPPAIIKKTNSPRIMPDRKIRNVARKDINNPFIFFLSIIQFAITYRC